MPDWGCSVRFANYPGSAECALPEMEAISREVVSLPEYPELNDEGSNVVGEAVGSCFDAQRLADW